MQANAPTELFPDIPTKPTDLTWDDLEWALFEDDLVPLVEAVVARFEAMLTPQFTAMSSPPARARARTSARASKR